MSSSAPIAGSVAAASDEPTTPDAPGPVTVASIRAAIAPTLGELARTAAARDADRVLPRAEIRQLARSGLLWLTVPVSDGGAGGSLTDLADLVITLARADSNVAQALRSSFLTANRLASMDDGPARRRLRARVLAGDLFSGTTNERGGAAGAVATTIRANGSGFIVDGTKYYSTGGLYADWFSGTARR